MYNEEVNAAPGSVSQVRESTGVLLRLAKGLGISVFIVGHVTKKGTVAGERVLEHMVDTVLYFEGDRHASYRILRGVKNRFGSTNEIGVFEMRQEGLVEVEKSFGVYVKRKTAGSQRLGRFLFDGGDTPDADRNSGACMSQQFRYPAQTDDGNGFQQGQSFDGGAGEAARDAGRRLRCLCEHRGGH